MTCTQRCRQADYTFRLLSHPIHLPYPSMPTAPSPGFILLDTNCFLRIYCSPVLPLLGQVVGGYRLLTLASLIDEFKGNPRLVQTFSHVGIAPRSLDLDRGALRLTQPKKRLVETQRTQLAVYARLFVQHRNAGGAGLMPLSREDIELLATAIVLRGIIATDEKALTQLTQDLISSDEDAPQACIDSLALLHLLEQHARLSPQQRRDTVSTWLRIDTLLPAHWRRRYRALFGESADAL